MASFLRAMRRLGQNRNYDLLPASPSLQPSPVQQDYDLESNVELSSSAYGYLQRRPILRGMLQLAALFLMGSIVLGGTLLYALPPLDESDRAVFHVPTSFDELKALNSLLQKLKVLYPLRTVTCYVVTYLYLQAFSLPGSMYLSILAGAVWGPAIAIPLCCSCVATGATLCYLISACLGPAVMAIPKLKSKIDLVAQKMEEPSHKANLIPYMIVLRMAPLPPHWAINITCPHVGIGIPFFWVSAFLGIMGVTVIHTTIGGGLEQMTSSDDFHLISWRNFFGLAAVICAACVPIILRWRYREQLDEVDGPFPVVSDREMAQMNPPGSAFVSQHTLPEIVINGPEAPSRGLGLFGGSASPARRAIGLPSRSSLDDVALQAR